MEWVERGGERGGCNRCWGLNGSDSRTWPNTFEVIALLVINGKQKIKSSWVPALEACVHEVGTHGHPRANSAFLQYEEE